MPVLVFKSRQTNKLAHWHHRGGSKLEQPLSETALKRDLNTHTGNTKWAFHFEDVGIKVQKIQAKHPAHSTGHSGPQTVWRDKKTVVQTDQVPSSHWKAGQGTFLVVPWIRIHVPTQGTRVPPLGPQRPHMPQGNWVRGPQLLASVWQLLKPTHPRARALQ